MKVWSVRVTDEHDTDYNDMPIREVLMPNGEWRGCIAVSEDDARKSMQEEWAKENKSYNNNVKVYEESEHLPSDLIFYALTDATSFSAKVHFAAGGNVQYEFDRKSINQLREKLRPDSSTVNTQSMHPSHITRFSDSSYYDEVCTICGATDITGGGWGKLAEPCPGKRGA